MQLKIGKPTRMWAHTFGGEVESFSDGAQRIFPTEGQAKVYTTDRLTIERVLVTVTRVPAKKAKRA